MSEERKTIRQPLNTGVAKVPVIMQMEALECGAASLAMVLAYYEKWVPLEQVRLDCGVSRDGSNMKNVVKAAQYYGLEVHGYKFDVEQLKKNATYPCIIHWNFNHFVVLDGFKGDKAVLNDPARGEVEVSMEEFDQSYTGVVMTFAPGENFVPSGKPKSVWEFASKRLKGAGAAVAFVTLTMVISYLFGIINPVMSRIFFDRLLTGRAPDWLYPVLWAMAILAVFQIVTNWAKTVYSLKINGKMAIEGNVKYMWKVLRLPMEFFSQRMAGDIMARQDTNASIAKTLVDTVAPLALNTVMMLFYLFVMLRYSPVMTLVGIVSLLLNLFIAQYLSQKRVNLSRLMMRDSGKLASATMAGISMTETIKASGAEEGFFQKWSGYQAAVSAQQAKADETNGRIGVLPQFISTVSNYMVLFLGVQMAMEGNFTLGMISTFQGLLSSFMGPAMTLIGAGQTIQEMRTQMERVEDVMQYPDDPIMQTESLTTDGESKKLSGDVELRHVTFGYSRLGRATVTDFSMHLKPGARVAIVGPSGCGKSTVSKLVTGLHQPWEGEILFDGKPIQEIPRSVFTGSVAMVDQEIVLFEDTVANNIRMWDNTITDDQIIKAAKDAQIHDDIVKRPGGYQAKLSENGKDMSGGQRQRIEIARVLAQEPSVIIMDEATSALDAKTEYEVVKAVKERGITCIVVAHRLSTIRDCDEIIVLNRGVVVERGTHDELFAKGGAYAQLVTSE
ncbi:MAG: NHLP family bacteriocin export ABC transporter peptidase/permease/ATPase subunit [Clostridia bacterium]|nr:NHLP family bacteriocin export ABC transporter peptidase/permease/ATPase subunit [Clostridia bacterium]